MRFYVSILAALGLTASACGKKEEKKPVPTTQEVKKEEPVKKEPVAEAPKKEEPVAEAPKKEEPVAENKGQDRTAAMQQAFADYVAGKLDDTFKNFTADATWTEVGMPNGEFKGTEAIKQFHAAQQASFSELTMKIGRIIEAGEYQVVEYVWLGKNTGKLMNGAEATNKVAVVPGALVVHYTAEGQVDKAWAFQDGMGAMQQLGVFPGLPENFAPTAMPETTEIVKGDFNPALLEVYKTFGAKMGTDAVDAAIDEMVADDYTMVATHSGQTIKGKDGLKAMMKEWSKMFQMTGMSVDMAFGAGDYLVVIGKTTMTYKGGFPGVEPKDQQVTTTSVDIAKFEGTKFKSYVSYGNGMEVALQLGMMGGAAAKPEEPKAEEPKAGEPKAEEPKAEEGKPAEGAKPEEGKPAEGAKPEEGKHE